MQIDDNVAARILEALPGRDALRWAAIVGETEGRYAVHAISTGRSGALQARAGDIRVEVGVLNVNDFCGGFIRQIQNLQSVYAARTLIGHDVAGNIARAYRQANPNGLPPGLLAAQAVSDARNVAHSSAAAQTQNVVWVSALRQRALAQYLSAHRELPPSSEALYQHAQTLTSPWALALRVPSRSADEFRLEVFQVDALSHLATAQNPAITMPAITPEVLGLEERAPVVNITARAPAAAPPVERNEVTAQPPGGAQAPQAPQTAELTDEQRAERIAQIMDRAARRVNQMPPQVPEGLHAEVARSIRAVLSM